MNTDDHCLRPVLFSLVWRRLPQGLGQEPSLASFDVLFAVGFVPHGPLTCAKPAYVIARVKTVRIKGTVFVSFYRFWSNFWGQQVLCGASWCFIPWLPHGNWYLATSWSEVATRAAGWALLLSLVVGSLHACSSREEKGTTASVKCTLRNRWGVPPQSCVALFGHNFFSHVLLYRARFGTASTATCCDRPHQNHHCTS